MIKFERWLRGLVEGRYGRWIMLGLLIAILSGFTVMSEIGDWLRGIFMGSKVTTETDIAGSFAVLPGEVTEVDHASFEAARRRYGVAQYFLLRVPSDRVRDMDVWTHLLLLEAAKKEGIAVSTDELRNVMSKGVPDYVFKDQGQYRKWARDNFGVTAPALEAAVLEYLTALRVLDVYSDSFLIGPAATRKAAVEQAASQSVEYAFGDYAALDVSRFLGEAETELKSEADPEKKLREFFDKDPSVTLEPEKFRHPRRFRIELLYTIHANVDSDEKLERIRDVVTKTYPEARFQEVNVADRKTYYGTYRDRLLKMAGESLASVTDKVEKEEKGTTPPKAPDGTGSEPGAQKPDEPGAQKPDEPGAQDPNGPGGRKPEGPEAPGQAKPDEPKPEPSQALRARINEYGYQIVKEQVGREVALRTIYEFLHEQAKDNVSLKEMFEKLKAHDDPQNPICSTEPGKGLLMYRDFDGKPLSGDELQEIEDSGVKFGFSFKPRVTGLGDTDLPKKSKKADTLGDEGHGRQIFRLLEVIREQRKTFDELTAGEKEDLKRLFYLPERARARAKEKLESLRQRLTDGSVKPEQFRAEAEALGCRVHEGEWIEASYENVREPEKKKLWPDEFLHMRDRYFLKKSLAQVLDRDRAKPAGKEEWKPPCFLPVDVDTRRGAEEPGAAYLFHLRERKRPDATTIAADEMSRYLRTFASQKVHEVQERWMGEASQLIGDFRMVFDKEMQVRIDEDLKRRDESRRGAKPR